MILGIFFEWSLFPSTNIKREVSVVLNSLLKKRYEKRKTHNMLFFMLNLKFKNLCLIPCILCFWSVIIICIQWQNFLDVSIELLMKILILIFFNELYSQASKQMNLSLGNYWFFRFPKWIPMTSSVFSNGGENMKPCCP
jgi:hypothetical protein